MGSSIVRKGSLLLLLLVLLPVSIFAEGKKEVPLVLYADMVRGHSGQTGPTCALTSQYQRGELVVWRMRVFDTTTEQLVPQDIGVEELLAEKPDKEALKKGLVALSKDIKVVVHLSDGQSFPAHFGIHGGKQPDGGDNFWTTSWEIPAEYPTGTLEYWITVDVPAEKKSGRFDPFNVNISKLTIAERTFVEPKKES